MDAKTEKSLTRIREELALYEPIAAALEVNPGESLTTHAIGALISRLEAAAGRPVDLVLLDEAPSPLAYRVFRDGKLLFERSHAALVERKTSAILEYLDFKPIEDECTRGVLAAANGR